MLHASLADSRRRHRRCAARGITGRTAPSKKSETRVCFSRPRNRNDYILPVAELNRQGT